MSIRHTLRFAAVLLAGAAFAAPLAAQGHDHPAAVATASDDAQKAFAILKSLAGAWQAKGTDSEQKMKMPSQITMRPTSRGNALVHEMMSPEEIDNSLKYDHPVTMIYLDGANLQLTHYCDAGNRPRMVARVSADGKVVDFDFIDVVGSTRLGHMHHARFTVIDDTHHLEDWTYELPGGKTAVGHFDLVRTANVASVHPK